MTKIKLYSPPIITAKRKIKIGHGANLVWCDILARNFSRQGFSVNYHFPSWNHQGKMFDDLSKTDGLEKVLSEIERAFEDKVSLFKLKKYSPYKDTSKESRENTKDKFNILKEKGFVVFDNGSYFIRIDKIKEETGLVDHIKSVEFFPKEAKKRILDLIKNLNGYYPITKQREFATSIPGDESNQKINPIFDLAVSPFLFSSEPVDYAIDGLKTMLHGIFIPFVIWSGLYDIPFSRKVAVHGYLLTDQNLEDLTRKTNSDVLRGSALLCTNSVDDTKLDQSRIKKILKGTSKLIKLAWFFKDFQFHEDFICQQPSQNLNNCVQSMRHSLAMDNIIERTLSLSQQLELGKLTGKNYCEYASLLKDASDFFPSTYQRAVEILKKKILVT